MEVWWLCLVSGIIGFLLGIAASIAALAWVADDTWWIPPLVENITIRKRKQNNGL